MPSGLRGWTLAAETLKTSAMKRSFLPFLFLLIGVAAQAQPPQGFNYQAVVRDANGDPIANTAVSFRMGLHYVVTDPAIYQETHNVVTNALGLVDLVVGNGTPVTGTLAAIDWANSPVHLKVEMDPAGGSSYTELGTQQLRSVPYALHAATVADKDDADADPTNEVNTALALDGDSLAITDGGGTLKVDLSGLRNLAPGSGITGPGCIPQPDDLSAQYTSGANGGSVQTSYWQSFTVHSTGDLVDVSWYEIYFHMTTGTLNMYSGEGNGGTLLLTQPLGATVTGWNTATLATPIPVVASAVYTMELISPTNFIWVQNNAETYTEGRSSEGPITDQKFRTTVTNVCVAGTVDLLQVDPDGGVQLSQVDTIHFSDGTSMSTAPTDVDPTNELNTALALDGDSLAITDAGGTLKVDLSGLRNLSAGSGISSTTCIPQADDNSAGYSAAWTSEINTTATWQSFTANSSGDLNSVSWRGGFYTMTSGTLSIYSGEGNTGALLHSQSLSTSVNGWNTITLTDLVPVNENLVYTVELASADSFLWRTNHFDPYAGGRAATSSTHDMLFGTNITNSCVAASVSILSVNADGNVQFDQVDTIHFSDGTFQTTAMSAPPMGYAKTAAPNSYAGNSGWKNATNTVAQAVTTGDRLMIQAQTMCYLGGGSGIDDFQYRVQITGCASTTTALLTYRPPLDVTEHGRPMPISYLDVWEAPCTGSVNLQFQVQNTGDDNWNIFNRLLVVTNEH